MERAGQAVAEVVLERFPGKVTVVCGGGNNGGDGRICARVLRAAGRDVTLVEAFGEFGEPDVIVDALLGIGLQDAPREDVARVIERINSAGVPVVSIDVPSGVNASTGEVPGAAVEATATVTFGAAKLGLVVAPGRFHSGERPRCADRPGDCRERALAGACGDPARRPAQGGVRARSTAPARCSSSAARPG